MKFTRLFAPVAVAAALALTACAPTTAPAPAASTPAPFALPAALQPSTAPVIPAALAAPAVSTPAVAPAPTLDTTATDTITAPSAQCEEDEPCWDCATMGNMICGPDLAPAPVATFTTPVQRKYIPCSAVGKVADAMGVCHAPVAPAPAAGGPTEGTTKTDFTGTFKGLPSSCTPTISASFAPFAASPVQMSEALYLYKAKFGVDGAAKFVTATCGSNVPRQYVGIPSSTPNVFYAFK